MGDKETKKKKRKKKRRKVGENVKYGLIGRRRVFFFFSWIGRRKYQTEKRRGRKWVDDVAIDVAQEKFSNNKCYTSNFRYI